MRALPVLFESEIDDGNRPAWRNEMCIGHKSALLCETQCKVTKNPDVFEIKMAGAAGLRPRRGGVIIS